MKVKRIFSRLLAFIMVMLLFSTLLITAKAKAISYSDFNISGDAPIGPNGISFDKDTKTFILALHPDGDSYYVTLSGEARGKTYCSFTVADNAKADIVLDNVQIRVPAEAGKTPAIFVGRGCEVNIYLKGENVI